MTLTYDQALEFLFPRTTTIKFGLGDHARPARRRWATRTR